MKKTILSVFLAGLWISLSEFVRNEFLLKPYWVDHYEGMGQVFPAEPVNGAIWGLWSFLFAWFIYLIQRRSGFAETILISWLAGFVFMWLVIGNLGVLPFGILPFAIPLSLLEVVVAAYIIRSLSGRKA
jgi:hypothetical protein